MSLEWDRSCLADLAASDPGAILVLVRAPGQLPLRAGAPRLPARVQVTARPPYSPELNPCAPLWDIVKDARANRVHATITALRKSLRATLRRYWADAASVLLACLSLDSVARALPWAGMWAPVGAHARSTPRDMTSASLFLPFGTHERDQVNKNHFGSQDNRIAAMIFFPQKTTQNVSITKG